MRAATPLDQPRAIGAASVSSKNASGRSVLDGLRQSGALKLLFPRRKDIVEAVAINTAGGVTGGDRFELTAKSGRHSHLMITTQAAERAYRAQYDQTGHIRTRLEVLEDSTLFWLPQELILYQQASLMRHLSVTLAPSARFLMVEPVLFGRRAMGEDVTRGSFTDRIEILRAGQPLYQDGVSLRGNIAAKLDRPAIANGARAMASLVWVAPDAPSRIDAIRKILGHRGGASLIQDDVLVLRLLAEDGFALRKHLLPVLDLLTENKLPQSWRL